MDESFATYVGGYAHLRPVCDRRHDFERLLPCNQRCKQQHDGKALTHDAFASAHDQDDGQGDDEYHALGCHAAEYRT